MVNKKVREERQYLRDAAEKLLVETEMQNQARDTLDKSINSINQMNAYVEEESNLKKELIENIRVYRENPNSFRNKKALMISLRNIQELTGTDLDLIAIEQLKVVDYDKEDFATTSYNRKFAKQAGINLDSPFLNLYSKSDQVNMAQEMIKKFDLLELDEIDYGFAVCAALIAGLIDVFLVGTITNQEKNISYLQGHVDKIYRDTVTKYGFNKKLDHLKHNLSAATKSSDKERIQNLIEKHLNSNKDNHFKIGVGYLEGDRRVSYDAVRHASVKGMEINNHHNVSLAHDFSPLGLLFGILDQLTGKASFLSPKTGEFIRVATDNKNKDFSGNTFQQIIQATNNWFGHCLSDIAGSKDTKVRGTGLPAPFWPYLQSLKFGDFYINDRNPSMTMGELSDWMFKNGYDHRAFTTELIPVVIFETLIRGYWFYKQKFYYGKSMKESLPIANSRELSRLLMVATATFSTIDVSHATIKAIKKANGSPMFIGEFMMTVNKVGLVDLGFRSFQSVRNEIIHRKHVDRVLEEDILMEYQRVTRGYTG